MTPTDIRRVKLKEDANNIAAEQVKALLRRLPQRDAAPLFVFDAGYDPVKLQRELLRDRPVQLLVRLHSNRVFYADPEDPVPRPVGRPRRHGERFDLGDPETWPDPSAEHRCESEDYGSVTVRAWNHLHPKTRRIGERYGCAKAPVVKGTVVLMEVDRLPKETRKPKKLWLWWHGEGEPDLNLLWRLLPQVLSGARHPILEREARMDQAEAALSRAGGPMDMARRGRIRSARTREGSCGGPEATVGEAVASAAPYPDTGAEGISRPTADAE